MKTGKIPYKNINDTMLGLKQQVIDSLDYAEQNFPRFENPRELFDYLKQITIYKNDPPGVERLQSLPTLMRRDGKGDCDCFTIALLAVCWVQGKQFQNLYVVLAGRETIAPVHIYVKIFFDGEIYVMDLTQPEFNSERDYPFTQELRFRAPAHRKQVYYY